MQYGIRIYSKDFDSIGWQEFKVLLAGLGPDTPLGGIISIRSEEDKDVLKNFNKDQKRIRMEWRNRSAKRRSETDTNNYLESLKKALIGMAGN